MKLKATLIRYLTYFNVVFQPSVQTRNLNGKIQFSLPLGEPQ